MGIGLAITISPLLALATDDSSTNSEITITVILAVAIAVGTSVLLIAAYTTFRAGYSRRRRLPAMLAIWVLGQAEQGPVPAFKATGIGERNGNLIILLSAGWEDSVDVGERFIAYNDASGRKLGIIIAVEVDGDSCRCEVSDGMEQGEFWEELESRMTRDFSPPVGVTFSRQINPEVIESAKQLLRRWGG